MKRLLTFSLLILGVHFSAMAQETIRIGSKKFTEQYLVAEILAQLIEGETDLKVERRFGLGGTLVCFEALKKGEIDLYPEYSGTAKEELLGGRRVLDWEGLQKLFQSEFGLVWLEPFGFNNTYALAMPRKLAEKRGIEKISDLSTQTNLRYGLSHEFLSRRDGWGALQAAYSLRPGRLSGLDHGLAYEALVAGEVDLIDSYSTDAKIPKFGLLLLQDDRGFFPKYLAAPVIREEVLKKFPSLQETLNRLAGKISDEEMQRLNAEVELSGKSFAEVARAFLQSKGLRVSSTSQQKRTLWVLVGEHLFLTFVAVGFAVLTAVPLGLWMSRRKKLSQLILGVAGIVQTIPSIALLVFMIPFFGIGTVPAIVALFIYGLLPILQNTVTGIRGISPLLLESADGIGLTRWQRLLYVELPLATRSILAGIRISAVINIGTATLAAFIGAGGLGEPIVTGLALNNSKIILSGAIPAAALAVLTEIIFEGIEKWLTPRGLRT